MEISCRNKIAATAVFFAALILATNPLLNGAQAQLHPDLDDGGIVGIYVGQQTLPALLIVADDLEYIYQRKNTTTQDIIDASSLTLQVECRALDSTACGTVLTEIAANYENTGETAPTSMTSSDWNAPQHNFGQVTVFESSDPDGGPTARVAFQATGVPGVTDLERMIWFVDAAQAVAYFQTVDTATFGPASGYDDASAYWVASTP